MIHIHKLLQENEQKLLKEIGEGNSPQYNWSKQFYEIKEGIFTVFLVPYEDQTLQIDVGFMKIKDGKYEISFTVNDYDTQYEKLDIKVYLRIISTVFNIIKSFIEKYNPQVLLFGSSDKEDIKIPGQKDRIYFSYIEKNASKLGFRYGHEKNKLILIKNNE